MKFMKKNKSLIIGIIVFIVVFIVIYTVEKSFTSDESSAIYGNRLDGRNGLEITKETREKVKSKLSDDTESVDLRVAGRLVNIMIETESETSLKEAKEIVKKSLNVFSKEEKKYYDIQFFVENEKDEKSFPIIGYKHHTKDSINWTKDR